MKAGDFTFGVEWKLWVVPAITTIAIVVVIAGTWPESACPLQKGQEVYSYQANKSGVVVDIAGYASMTDGCFVAVRFNDGSFSMKQRGTETIDGDPRYVPNWELRKASQ